MRTYDVRTKLRKLYYTHIERRIEQRIERIIPVLPRITAYYYIIMDYLYVLLRIHEYTDVYSGIELYQTI